MTENEIFEGKIENIVFSNIESNFFIAKLKSDDDIISFKGTFPGVLLSIGQKVKIRGYWVDNQKFGKQVHAVSCEVIPEKGKNGVVSYLTGHVKSIGIITASKLYDRFGEELITILESDPERIREAEFLTSLQIESILKEWSEASESRTSAIFLTDIGFTPNQVKSIFEKYGKDTRKRIQANPYDSMYCSGVSFQSADTAAFRLGGSPDSPNRIKSFIIYTVNQLSNSSGHVFCTSDQIKEHISYLFKKSSITHFSSGPFLTDSQFYPNLSEIIKDGLLIDNDGCIYSPFFWKCENDSSDFLGGALNTPPRDLGDLDSLIKEFEESKGVSLSDEQRDAILKLRDSSIFVVSGFPGTGKTLLVSAFVYIFEKANLDYKLLSPTGIAAKRLSQVTGKPSSTVHRALGFDSESWKFDRSNKYHVDAIILDESSMVGITTFYHLLDALKRNTIIIFIGDREQLPSVDSGKVLDSLISCPDIPHVSLTRIYRQDKASDIIKVAHSILNNRPVNTSFNKDSEFIFLDYPKESVVSEICKLSSLLKEKKKQFQVISPMYGGIWGLII